MKLIGISGLARSGKDTFANLLVEESRNTYQIVHFADKLKEITAALLSLDINEVLSDSFKTTYFPEWSMTGREILQKIGTDCFRNNFDQNVWVKSAFSSLRTKQYGHQFIFPDVRFKNEFDIIKEKGGLCIKIERDLPNSDSHVSENEWQSLDFDIIVYNSSDMENLRSNARKVLEFCKFYFYGV